MEITVDIDNELENFNEHINVEKIENYIKDVLKKIDDALRFYYNEATDEIKEQLKDPLNWKNHTQLDYYKDIDALY